MITIEQYAAITSSVFAGITLWLAFKTKSLTDVVSEMKNQTTILVKSYELQNQLTLTDRIPYFKSGIFFRNKNNIEGYISLVNRGLTASKVKFFGPARRDINFTDTHNGDIVVKNDVVTFYCRTVNDGHDFKFNFLISFISEDGNEFTQDFKVVEGVVSCFPPILGLTK